MEDSFFEEEIDNLKDCFKNRGYKSEMVDKVIDKNKGLRHNTHKPWIKRAKNAESNIDKSNRHMGPQLMFTYCSNRSTGRKETGYVTVLKLKAKMCKPPTLIAIRPEVNRHWKMSPLQNKSVERIVFCYDDRNDSCIKLSRSFSATAALYCIAVLAITATVLGNLLVVIAVSHFRVLHSPTNFLTLSLALTDCLLGVMVLPFSSIRSVETCWYFGDKFCTLHSGFDTSWCLSSILHLCFISVDRYLAICYPLLYTSKMTVTVACIFIALSYVIAIVYTYGLLYSNIIDDTFRNAVPEEKCLGGCQLIFMRLWGWVTFPFFFVPCFIMIGLYAKIFFVAMKQARIIGSMIDYQNTLNVRASTRERKAAITLGVAVGVYSLCWIPFIIVTLIDPFQNFSTPPIIFDFFN
ncbi:trace amine-associated receptor 5-like [Protopterus annectens]|uniref:trace amine-associated receptor 5-like n=1 Tax=Protopterus annectens TaxID=7888 RepID=UPI001CFB64A4|nr:trace amine-associated receptor 5-like [Protopterus annectens]